MKTRNGFTLVEMAAVLVLMGVMLGALIGIYTRAFSGQSLKNQTDANTRGAKTIVAFAQINKYLPEDLNTVESIWRRKDTYGNDYEYIVAPELRNKSKICTASDVTSISTRFCDKADCSVMTQITPNIAFILLSHGRGTKADYQLQGNEYRFLRQEIDADDLPIYYTLSEVKAYLGCENTDLDENKLRFVNSDIVPLVINGAADAASVIVADGGTPFVGGEYEWCVDEFEPISINFYALNMSFYVQSGGSSVRLQRIAEANCATDAFAKGGKRLWIKYDNSTTIDGKPSLFYFTAHVKDNGGKFIAQRFLFQMYQK